MAGHREGRLTRKAGSQGRQVHREGRLIGLSRLTGKAELTGLDGEDARGSSVGRHIAHNVFL